MRCGCPHRRRIRGHHARRTALKFDPSIRSLHVWNPDETADEAFTDLQADAAQQAILEGRYESYRKTGLKGAGSPGEHLTLAINETEMLARFPGYAKALLEFPIDPLPRMEHRFFAYEQEVDKGRTFVPSHRSAVRGEHDALITEQRYYVSRLYDAASSPPAASNCGAGRWCSTSRGSSPIGLPASAAR